MKIGFDAKRYYHNQTGLGNYSRTLVHDLKEWFSELECVLYDEKSYSRSFRLGRRACEEGCTLFHGLSNELPFDSRRVPIPTVVTIHDVAWRTFPDMYKWVDRHIYDFKYGWAARNASMVVAISESTKRDVMRFYDVPEERIRVVYQPVQRRFYTPIPKDEARRMAEAVIPNLPQDYLLIVGSINSRKNLLSVLKALAAMSPEGRPPLVVVGSGREYKNVCEDYAQKNLRQTDVIWANNVNDAAALQALYACAMAMTYPSHYEGFGLPVVEALLQETPVLTSTISSLPEAAGPGALLVNPGVQDEVTEALGRLVDDRDLRLRLAKDGSRYCQENFTPHTLITQMEQLYEEVMRMS